MYSWDTLFISLPQIPPLFGRLTTIGHTFHLLQSLVIARLHVPPIVASDCKWRSCEASPFGRATSRNSFWLVELLIVRLLDTQSRTTGCATTHEWWCDHTRLAVRPCNTSLCLVIADSFEHDRRLILLVRSRTITHDHYDQWHVLSTIWQRFLYFLIVTWSQVWCDCGNRKHETSL